MLHGQARNSAIKDGCTAGNSKEQVTCRPFFKSDTEGKDRLELTILTIMTVETPPQIYKLMAHGLILVRDR
jgi:hypothetical protein